MNLNRNCEDIAMSFLVANATGAPPIWAKGNFIEKYCVTCPGPDKLSRAILHRRDERSKASPYPSHLYKWDKRVAIFVLLTSVSV